MKRLFSLSTLVLIAIVFLLSCNHKDKVTPTAVDQDDIAGTWKVDKYISIGYENGEVVYKDTTQYDPESVIKFTMDNKAYSRLITTRGFWDKQVELDTLKYKLTEMGISMPPLDDMDWEAYAYKIEKLTETSFVLLYRIKTGENKHEEDYSYFSKKDNTLAEKNQSNIIGTWNMDKTILNSNINGALVNSDTTLPENDSHIEFTKDKRYYLLLDDGIDVEKDTGDYIITEMQLFLKPFDQMGADGWGVYKIEDLDHSVFNFYGKGGSDEHNYDASFIYLSK